MKKRRVSFVLVGNSHFPSKMVREVGENPRKISGKFFNVDLSQSLLSSQLRLKFCSSEILDGSLLQP